MIFETRFAYTNKIGGIFYVKGIKLSLRAFISLSLFKISDLGGGKTDRMYNF